MDDEVNLVEILREAVEGFGYHVTTRSNGYDALAFMLETSKQVDLVLTDQMMPEMTGQQLSKALLESNPDLPIIMMTGFSGKFTKADAKAMGIRSYMTKPIKLENLRKAIESCLVNLDLEE